MKRLRLFAAAAAGAAAALVLSVSPAYAHASLIDSDPSDGETLESAPDTVTLEFSEPLDAPSTHLGLVGPDGTEVPTGTPQVLDNAATLAVSLPDPGTYTVSYRLVSQDGHPIDGSISFTTEQASATLPPPSPSASPSQSAADGGIGWGPVLAIAGGALVLIVIAVAVWRRAKR
ncbi:MAG: copper resistance CopC family protein [Stackebrandtia sp.]